MKTESEIREMLNKLKKENDFIMWWDSDEKNAVCAIIDALLWVLGDESGAPIDPEKWGEQDEI